MAARSVPSGVPISPLSWDAFSAPPVVSTETGRWSGPLLRVWSGVDTKITQPVLDQHYVTLHLGPPKRVQRRGEGANKTVETEPGFISVTPAGTSFKWTVQGYTTEFAHLYLRPSALKLLWTEEFDRDGSSLRLEEQLGLDDRLAGALLQEMVDETRRVAAASRLYLDQLEQTLTIKLLRSYASAPSAPFSKRHRIAPARLRRVRDFIEANLSRDIALADLARAAGMSPFHFSRAFAAEVGIAPYGYLIGRRVARAKDLLKAGTEPVAVVAHRCGFSSSAQFSRMFKRVVGTSPLLFRG